MSEAALLELGPVATTAIVSAAAAPGAAGDAMDGDPDDDANTDNGCGLHF